MKKTETVKGIPFWAAAAVCSASMVTGCAAAPPVKNAATPASHNAYDYYVRAAEMHSALLRANPKANAVDQVTDGRDSRGLTAQQLAQRYPLTAKEAWIKKNAPVFKLLREGFRYTYRVRQGDFFKRFSFFAGFRPLAHLLVIESHCHSERGDWARAADSAVDLLHLGRDQTHESLDGALHGRDINAIGRRVLWRIAPHLNSEQSCAVSLRIADLDRGRMPFADTLRQQKAFGLSELKRIMSDPHWRKNLARDLDESKETQPIRFFSRPQIIRNYTDYMDALIAQQRRPYVRRKLPPLPGDQLTRLLVGTGRWDWYPNLDEACNLALEVALAVRAFKLSRGVYPATLQTLAPGYLKAVPLDPFGNGEALHYRRTKQGYVLYSVGPDGKDDGGRPVYNPTRTGPGAYYIMPDSKGDMVAGINR